MWLTPCPRPLCWAGRRAPSGSVGRRRHQSGGSTASFSSGAVFFLRPRAGARGPWARGDSRPRHRTREQAQPNRLQSVHDPLRPAQERRSPPSPTFVA
eukprot:5645939-Pyramimonas_sp.AAC.1